MHIMPSLRDMTVEGLRKLARAYDIPGRSKMKGDELREAIQHQLNSYKTNDITEIVETNEILLDDATMNDIDSGMNDINSGMNDITSPDNNAVTLDQTHSHEIPQRRMGDPKRVRANRNRNKAARKSRRKNRSK